MYMSGRLKAAPWYLIKFELNRRQGGWRQLRRHVHSTAGYSLDHGLEYTELLH